MLDYRSSLLRLFALEDLPRGFTFIEPSAPPTMNDDTPGIFRMRYADLDVSKSYLPFLFVCRSELGTMNFSESVLRGSVLTWNDIIEVNFSGADLSHADLRCSLFEGCNFSKAILKNADLRLSEFTDAIFTEADLTGARVTQDQLSKLNLSSAQQSQVTISEPGEEPEGG